MPNKHAFIVFINIKCPVFFMMLKTPWKIGFSHWANVFLNKMKCYLISSFSFLGILETISSVQSLSRVWLFVTPWTPACQASLSITNSWSLFKLMSIESVMPSNHLILSLSLLLTPSIFTSIRVFSNESNLCIKWPKYWSFNVSISPSSDY